MSDAAQPNPSAESAKQQLFKSVKESMDKMRGAFMSNSQRELSKEAQRHSIHVENNSVLQEISSTLKDQLSFFKMQEKRESMARKKAGPTEREDDKSPLKKPKKDKEKDTDVEEDTDGVFSKILSGIAGLYAGSRLAGLLSSITAGLSKVLSTAPLAGLAAGIIWTVVEGIKGFFKAEDWGVSRISGVVGSIFGGAGDGGIMDAMKGAGRWALIGAGIGSVVPVIGTLTGGLVGAAIGGILGFIGGENIAKALDSVGKSIKNMFNAIVESDYFDFMKDAMMSTFNLIISPFQGLFDSIMETINNTIGIWSDEESSILEKIGATVGELFFAPFRWMIGWTHGLVEGVVEWFKDWFTGEESLIVRMFETEPFQGLFDSIMETINNTIGIWSDEESSILEKIGATVGELFFAPFRWLIGWTSGLVEGIVEWFEDWFTGEESLIVRMFETEPFQWIFEQIKNLWKQIMRPIRKVGDSIRDTIDDIQREWGQEDRSIFQRIIDVIGELFEGVWDAIVQYFEGLFEGIINWFSGLFGVEDIFNDDDRNGLFDMIRNWLTNDFPKFLRGFLDSAIEAFEDVSEFGNMIMDSIIEPIRNLLSNFGDFWQDIDWTSLIPESVRNIVDGAGNLLEGGRERVGNVLNNLTGRDTQSENDAIITSEGKVISLHKNDNIIATQNEPMVGSAINQLSENRDIDERSQRMRGNGMGNITSQNVNDNKTQQLFISQNGHSESTLDRIFATER